MSGVQQQRQGKKMATIAPTIKQATNGTCLAL